VGWLDGKVALITGGGSGLGRVVVERFVAEGATVGALERSAERVAELRAAFPSSVVAIQGDVRSVEDNERAVTATVQAFGKLDVFVGNAGVFDNRIGLREIPAEKLRDAFDELFGVDVKAYMIGAKACLFELEKTEGCIIFTASISGLAAGPYGGVLYIPAKHAVVGLTRQLAYELAPIRVNAVAPGGVATNLQGLSTLDQTRHESLGTLRPPEDYVGSTCCWLQIMERRCPGRSSALTGAVPSGDLRNNTYATYQGGSP
jgi:NAD(P)-dependent dehydrogenase (short-subunit alcohol dehydrogenase family)